MVVLDSKHIILIIKIALCSTILYCELLSRTAFFLTFLGQSLAFSSAIDFLVNRWLYRQILTPMVNSWLFGQPSAFSVKLWPTCKFWRFRSFSPKKSFAWLSNHYRVSEYHKTHKNEIKTLNRLFHAYLKNLYKFLKIKEIV